MNLSMRAASPEAAFREALDYWARRAQEAEEKLRAVTAHIEVFFNNVYPPEED